MYTRPRQVAKTIEEKTKKTQSLRAVSRSVKAEKMVTKCLTEDVCPRCIENSDDSSAVERKTA